MSNYEVIAEGGHKCSLPDAADFESGTQIACRDVILRLGVREPCNKHYYRFTRFWSRRPYWSDDWGW